MKISVGQALLILLDKYRHDKDKSMQLKKLYLSGAKDKESLELIDEYLKDNTLGSYEISRDAATINNDNTRRYFETHLAYETIYNKIENLESAELNNYLELVKNLIPAYYGLSWDKVMKSLEKSGDNTDREYFDYLSKLSNNEIFIVPDISAQNRAKIATMVTASYIAIVLAGIDSSILPLDLYGEGIYLQRGKKAKDNQETTETRGYGLLKGHHALPRDDAALMAKNYESLKPSDQSDFDLQADWVQQNFARLIHPFSNSISGTLLCQMRVVCKVRENLKEDELMVNSFPLSAEKMKDFITVFIAMMLYNSGGHSLYEYTAVLELEKIKNAFSDVEGFEEFNLETLFLTSNEDAFDVALDRAIQYNNRQLSLAIVHEELQDKKIEFDREELIKSVKNINQSIDESLFSDELKTGFKNLVNTDVDKAKLCFKSAENIANYLEDNKSRIEGELFTHYRQGATRNNMINANLNQAIDHLSQGDLTQAKELIRRDD